MSITNNPQSRSFLLGAITLLFLFTFGSLCNADEAELNLVKRGIGKRRARWVAGETYISKLRPEHRRSRLGLLSPTPDEIQGTLDLRASAPVSLAAPYGTFDWRSYNGVNFVSAVKDQGNCGSCWAFASTAALESQVALGTSGTQPDLAEQILVSCSGAGSCNGGSPNKAADFIEKTGLPNESCFPYTAANTSCGSACINWQNSSDRITTWHWVNTTSPTVDAIKNALYTYGPLVTTMRVYADFFYYKSGVYSYTNGSYQGGHAVLLVGYDDNNQCFIVKNSWGTKWGELGFFRIAYSELNDVVQFGFYTIAYEGSQPAPSPVVPAAPSGLTATAASSSQINLSWSDGSNDEDGFRIERCQGPGCTSFTQVAIVGTGVKSYSNSGLTANTPYTYRVCAYNSAGNSGYSNSAAATTLPASQLPTAPSGLTATAVSRSQINLSWADNSNNEDGYKVERCRGSRCTNFQQIAVTGPNVTSYANTGLRRRTAYSYRVRAYNSTGNSGYSNTSGATTSR
jgi:C1A family cysteine protease